MEHLNLEILGPSGPEFGPAGEGARIAACYRCDAAYDHNFNPFGCPFCHGCGECGCCPCGKPTCIWCENAPAEKKA